MKILGIKPQYLFVGILVVFLAAFPFIPRGGSVRENGGNYLSGLLVVWYHTKVSGSSGGFIDLNPFKGMDWYSPVWFADPTSFHTIDERYAADRFSVFMGGERISNTDGSTFRSLGNGCYVDSRNARCEGVLILKRTDSNAESESFDVTTFTGNMMQRYSQGERKNKPSRLEGEALPAMYVRDATGVYFWDSMRATSEQIGSYDSRVPIYTRVAGVDAETFEVWSIHTCQLDKYGNCLPYYYDDCLVRDKNFVFEAELVSCKMTGVKHPR